MMVVPLNATPAQAFKVTLNKQDCELRISQKSTGIFMDVIVNNVLIIGGVLCLDRTLIVRDAYLGYSGDLFFVDTQGATDPVWTGLGSRYLLVSVAPGEL